jgi:diguanylate cyclase (GGDEF)-like protein
VAESTSQLVDRSEELQQANFKLRRLVTVDGLTGVANRRLFDDVLAREWQRASSGGGPLSLILVDIDFFKMYNDTNGHLRGDDCLVRVATTLDTTVTRGADLVARYGGDEFAVILPETDEHAALAVAERMRERVEALGITHPEPAIGGRVTVSAGIASLVRTSASAPEDLLFGADRALYHAKQTGRNRVVAAPVPRDTAREAGTLNP